MTTFDDARSVVHFDLPERGPSLPLALAALASRPRWVSYRLEWVAAKDKYDKIPHNGRRGLSTAALADWMTLEQALRLAEGNKLSGAGIVMTAPPITEGDWVLLGCDFDKVRDSVVEIPFFETLNTYTETSPSGKGLRAFA